MSQNDGSGRWISSNVSTSAGSRDFKLWIPRQCESQVPVALLVLLHGCRQKVDNLALISGMNQVANEHGFLVVYPQQRRRANLLRCWNWFEPRQQSRSGSEPSLLADITREVTTTFNIDRRRAYAAGISAGGAMAVILAVTYPDVFSAIGLVAAVQYGAASDASGGWKVMHHGGPDPSRQGLLAFQAMQAGLALRPCLRLPVICFHGDRDSAVASVNADQLIAQWAATNTLLSQTAGRNLSLSVRNTEDSSPGRDGYVRRQYSDQAGRLLMEEW
ncbi:MAG: PHB depolymerase family esterase, partial [Acidobacteriales bacterium]|nr:PHB depolymerase family esterase [Terriglobales bacterium]